MELSRNRAEEPNKPGWVELLVLSWRAHSTAPNQKMESKSQLDHISMKNEAMPQHIHNTEKLS